MPFPSGYTGDAYYDFNGDGKPDLQYTMNGFCYVMLSTPTGYATGISTGAPSCTISAIGGAGDLTGSGRDGFITSNADGTFWYYTYNGSNFVSASTGIPFSPQSQGYRFVDTEGNGRPNLLRLMGNTLNLYHNTSSGSTVSFDPTPIAVATVNGSNPEIILQHKSVGRLDFNGDGREDMMIRATVGCCLTKTEMISTGLGFTQGAVFTGPSGGTSPVEAYANWNSDRCTDLVIGDGTTSYVYLSPCNGGAPAAVALPTSTVLGTMDWDGDGLSDLMVANGSTIGIYRSTETDVSSLIPTTVPYVATTAYNAWDINGDGLDEILPNTGTSPNTYFAHNGAGSPPDLLTSITDGFGMKFSPTYVAIAQSNYTISAMGSWPDASYAGPMVVVSQFTANDGVTSTSTYQKSFWYYNATTNVQGLGFNGFYSQRTLDSPEWHISLSVLREVVSDKRNGVAR